MWDWTLLVLHDLQLEDNAKACCVVHLRMNMTEVNNRRS